MGHLEGNCPSYIWDARFLKVNIAMYVASHFCNWMPRLEKFPLRAGSPQCISLCQPHSAHLDGWPDNTCFSFKNIFTYSATSPPELALVLYCVTEYSQNWSTSEVFLFSTDLRTILPFRLYNAPRCTIALVHTVGACVTPREQQNEIAVVPNYCMIQFLRSQNLTFDNSLSRHLAGQSAPTYTVGWPIGNSPYLQV